MTGRVETVTVSLPAIPTEVAVKRSDPLYNAHAYLTKVPVSAIEPFIEAFTQPGDVVLDMYGGSGMTGVTAMMLGRHGEVRDISVLGRHIGTNYVNLVDEAAFRAGAQRVVSLARSRVGDVYSTPCRRCERDGELSRTVWSFVYACDACGAEVNYYKAFEASGWRKSAMKCPNCESVFRTRGARRLTETQILDTISCKCSSTLLDQEHTTPRYSSNIGDAPVPDLEIGVDRQMFQASALAKHGLVTTSSFFSPRNLAVLAALRRAIGEVEEESIRAKLLFAFTAILARASKRYQWHPKRPLNASNQNYYVAPVFYEWNVYALFERKVSAAVRADDYLRTQAGRLGCPGLGSVNYVLGSANAVDLPDESVDYVFTDPPFGSNIFYSDMNLFQEAWLGEVTDHGNEAVVDRSGNGSKRRTTERYERLITESLKEAHRVLVPEGWLSLVFSNSTGAMWALVQRAVSAAGFSLQEISTLDKGQRSTKGLASGFENVVTVDLILSMRKAPKGSLGAITQPPQDALDLAVDDVLSTTRNPSPSHVYVGVIRYFLRRRWDVTDLDIEGIGSALRHRGYDVDARTGRLLPAVAVELAS